MSNESLVIPMEGLQKGLEAEYSKHDGVKRCLFCNILSNVLVCGACVQQERYEALDMATAMDTHADVTDSERSKSLASQSLSMTYDHTPPGIAVQQTFPSHEDWREKNIAEVNIFKSLIFACTEQPTSARRSDLWRELRNRVVTEGSSAIAHAHDVRPNRFMRRRLGIPVASDHENSHGDMARCANAVSVIRDPVSSGVPPCFTQNQVPDTCETSSYNATNQSRSPHVAIKFPETCFIQTDVRGTSEASSSNASNRKHGSQHTLPTADMHEHFPTRNVRSRMMNSPAVCDTSICPNSQNTNIDTPKPGFTQSQAREDYEPFSSNTRSRKQVSQWDVPPANTQNNHSNRNVRRRLMDSSGCPPS
ncbi:hypothetical protein Tco_0108874 [Tanacetum coccineum]